MQNSNKITESLIPFLQCQTPYQNPQHTVRNIGVNVSVLQGQLNTNQ